MKQKDKNIVTFLKYGVAEKIANRVVASDFTVSKIQNASRKDLESILNVDEIDDLFFKVKRQPIPNEVYERLVKETELHCCFCWNILEEKPVIIHHIDEYNKTQDNSFNNLIVLCLNHHGDVHVKREISQQNFSKIRLLEQKEKWISALADYRKGLRPAPGVESQGSVQNVSSSPSSIITQNQVGDNYQFNEVRLKSKLKYFSGDTNSEMNNGLYETVFVFGSEEGIGLRNPEVEVHFYDKYNEASGGVMGSGIVSAGRLEKKEDNKRKWYNIKTDFLHANNYLVIKIFSENILKIRKLEMKP